jgi:PhoH-like ATPase
VGSPRLFVLDTNVLLHDPSAIFRFEEHDVYLPMMVLEELDAVKKGMSELARNARQTSRVLEEILHAGDGRDLALGLRIERLFEGRDNGDDSHPTGRLFFQSERFDDALPVDIPGHQPDNAILAVTLALTRRHPSRRVTLVTKDINLRIKARVLGIHTEDYGSDRAVEDATLFVRGLEPLAEDFWSRHAEDLRSWNRDGRTYYEVEGDDVAVWTPNLGVYDAGGDGAGFEALVRKVEGRRALLEVATDYRQRRGVWGVHARNREQNFALNLLLDPEVDFVTILGPAGTGKTLLALAAGLEQTVEEHRYREIIVTRITVPLGEEIGYLPGTEEEKMTPWMGALLDNLEVLSGSGQGTWERQATHDLLGSRIKIRSLNFMRGRTFLNRYVIIDEAQNLTPKQMRALVTRAGPDTKVVCLGNIGQIDTPYLTERTSGLTYVVERFRGWPHAGHVVLARGERSRLADHASNVL